MLFDLLHAKLVGMDAFSFLDSKILLAKLSLFEFGAIFAEWPWQFISIFVTSVCRWLSLRG